MPYATVAAKISFLGALPGGESFATSFWISPTWSDQAGLNACLAAIKTHALAQFLPGATSILGSGGSYENVRAGFYPASAAHQELSGQLALGTTGTTGTGSAVHPNQISMVATLRTGLTGRSFRGRMYLPATGCSMTASTGLAATGVDSTVASAVASFFSACNADGAVGIVSVASSRVGVLTPVNRVGVDLRLDVQRRRANSQDTGGGSEASVT